VLRAGANGYRQVLEHRDEIHALSPRAPKLCTALAADVTARLEDGFAAWSQALDEPRR
jgi:hypothetical protein